MNQILQDLCRDLAAALSRPLHAIILGGNYGRGEGGTRSVTEAHGSGVWSIGEAPADDIDLLLVSWYSLKGRREAVSRVLEKYERIFTVPIDLAPVITPARLFLIPHRFTWRRLVTNSKVLYGPPHLQGILYNRYGRSISSDPSLAWSILLDQGLRLIDVLARDQGVVRNQRTANPAIHQGKFFREIALAIVLSRGMYAESLEMQFHEFLAVSEELSTDLPHLRLLKALLPGAMQFLKDPAQPGLHMPENWLYHLNLWLEADEFLVRELKSGPGFLQNARIQRCRRTVRIILQKDGVIPEDLFFSVKSQIRLLDWTRSHVFFI